jgi:hypothetical protein
MLFSFLPLYYFLILIPHTFPAPFSFSSFLFSFPFLFFLLSLSSFPLCPLFPLWILMRFLSWRDKTAKKGNTLKSLWTYFFLLAPINKCPQMSAWVGKSGFCPRCIIYAIYLFFCLFIYQSTSIYSYVSVSQSTYPYLYLIFYLTIHVFFFYPSF